MVTRAFILGVTACSTVLAASAGAHATVAEAMTLTDALTYARAHRPEVRAALARVGEASELAAASRDQWFPSFIATAQVLATTTNNTTGSYLPVPSFDNPRVSATRAESSSTASLAPEATTLLGVSGRQEIFDFGRIAAQAAVQDLRADARRFEAESARLSVDYDVEEAYFAVSTAKSILDAAQHAY